MTVFVQQIVALAIFGQHKVARPVFTDVQRVRWADCRCVAAVMDAPVPVEDVIPLRVSGQPEPDGDVLCEYVGVAGVNLVRRYAATVDVADIYPKRRPLAASGVTANDRTRWSLNVGGASKILGAVLGRATTPLSLMT